MVLFGPETEMQSTRVVAGKSLPPGSKSSPMKSMSEKGMCMSSWILVMPKALSIPGLVMSMEVVPPILTSKSGRRERRNSLISSLMDLFGSKTDLASMGAFWPRAEKVIWESRSSIMSPQVFFG